MSGWKKAVAIAVGVTAIIGAGHQVWGILTKVDSRWERADAAEQKYQETQEQLRNIGNILQTNAIEKLEAELAELTVKRNKTVEDEKRILELKNRIKRLEGGPKK